MFGALIRVALLGGALLGGALLGGALQGCGYRLGRIEVSYGDATPLALVQPSTDTRRWYVPVYSDTLGPHLFFVDTGYDYTTCDDDLIAGLGLETRGRVHIRGELGKVRATKARLPPLELGGHRIGEIVCHVRDLNSTSSIGDPDEVPIAGVIGMDVLSQFRAAFDPRAGILTLQDPATVPRLARGDLGVAPLRSPLVGRRVRMALEIDGQRLWPILDTGATNTYIDGARIGLEPSYKLDGVTLRGTGNNGSTIRSVSYFEIENVTVGGLRTAPITLMDRDRRWWQPGLLGLDLLARFHQDYDFHRGRVRLTPTHPQPLPQWQEWPELSPGGVAGRLMDAGPSPANPALGSPEVSL
ncbi:MAG TPA: hypothetical protein ENK18_19635 [Deltaproteobacteria bacterium]|nr:hypothetical protein [Deltaproteobacteria bacterium]